MRALVLIHRWLGVAFCLLFSMWFATGVVMHFVPYPSLTEAERVAGLAPIGAGSLRNGPAAAVAVAGIHDATRVRLLSRPDGWVYLVQGGSIVRAVHAADLSPAAVQSERLALAIAVEHARRRGIDPSRAALGELADYDQWTVPNGLDPHRPLYRIALNDEAGAELYVSSRTGEVVRDTTRRERAWNYVGSVAHWIYPTALRRNWRAWDMTVWTLSLVAAFTALAGAVLGVLRTRLDHGRLTSPFRGWHAWHHWLGLGCMVFVLTWIFSGWLSMDHGRLFSTGKLTAAEESRLLDVPAWKDLPGLLTGVVSADALEIEWFGFAGRVYRRERLGFTSQRLSMAGEPASAVRERLRSDELTAGAMRLSPACGVAEPLDAGEPYSVTRSMPGAPVYRFVCGGEWFHVDSGNGAVLEKLDASRRSYRWLYGALHTLDFPVLVSRPTLRTFAITLFCGLGFVFSITAVVIGWRRIRRKSPHS
ncbi:MAG: hypothetical protein JWN13_2583 [Betaproteobacteria bacterium]|jgi:hypothetical protein|nr:hypothetical protein [Betaproteobacteria bacterium]